MLYDGTACEQKTKNAKKCRKLDVCGTFTIPPSTLRVATSLYTKEALNS
ncbi:hypothetical protein [uncultured Eubacterium sp.]|nr:hypothetical protein [uncultured Eubacterium sp.]